MATSVSGERGGGNRNRVRRTIGSPIRRDAVTRDLTGSRAIVTGASGGIGRAVAVALADVGAKVAVAARSTAHLEALAVELRAAGRNVLPVSCDVTVAADRERLVRTVAETWGGLDLLVNNAGV